MPTLRTRLSCPCKRHGKLTDEEIIERVQSRVSDPRFVEAVQADLKGEHCSNIYSSIFGYPKERGSRRSNHYRKGLVECSRGYRMAGMEWCQEAMEEFRLLRAQRKELSAEQRTVRKARMSETESAYNLAIRRGSMPDHGERLTSQDLEVFADLNQEERRKELRRVNHELETLQKEKRVLEELIYRNMGSK
jgi:hypothetical protein